MDRRTVRQSAIEVVQYDKQNNKVIVSIDVSLIYAFLKQIKISLGAGPESIETARQVEQHSYEIDARSAISDQENQHIRNSFHVHPSKVGKKSKRKTLSRWLLNHLLAPPPKVRQRQKRARPIANRENLRGIPLSKLQDQNTPTFEDMQSHLDNLFAILTQHSLSPNLPGFHVNATVASSEEPKLKAKPNSLSGASPNNEGVAGKGPSPNIAVRHGYWGYWSW
jgi:hypothetical protein